MTMLNEASKKVKKPSQKVGHNLGGKWTGPKGDMKQKVSHNLGGKMNGKSKKGY